MMILYPGWPPLMDLSAWNSLLFWTWLVLTWPLAPHPQMRLNLFGNTHRPFQVPHSYETKPYWLLFFIKKVVGSFFWNYTQYRVNWCCILQMGYMIHKIDINLGKNILIVWYTIWNQDQFKPNIEFYIFLQKDSNCRYHRRWIISIGKVQTLLYLHVTYS